MSRVFTDKKWKYDLHPSLRLVQSVIAGTKQKAGRIAGEWVRLEPWFSKTWQPGDIALVK
jgi:hypothetical protein